MRSLEVPSSREHTCLYVPFVLLLHISNAYHLETSEDLRVAPSYCPTSHEYRVTIRLTKDKAVPPLVRSAVPVGVSLFYKYATKHNPNRHYVPSDTPLVVVEHLL